jgi:predicted transcriptional regulator
MMFSYIFPNIERIVTVKFESKVDILVPLTAEIVSAYVSNNAVAATNLPGLIAEIYEALKIATESDQPEPEKMKPAVPIKKSVTPDYIISLEDGKKFKSLKRHLATHHGLTPDEYRAKWGLPADYPMLAPNYAAARSALAKSMGLGRKAKKRRLTTTNWTLGR